MSEENEPLERGGAFLVEEEDKKFESPRLLDPSGTPSNLRLWHLAIGVPCPTRTMSRDTALALRMMAVPMFAQMVPISPDSLEVGEARNRIVEIALEQNCKWLFFLDYDVAPPPNAIVKLLSLKVPIAAGVYHLKSIPSAPLIMVKGWPGAFEDYQIGDLVKVDGVGMGCTLIDMDVFKKIDPPWFRTVAGYSDANPNAILPYMTEDIYFCDKARAAGYEIVVDTSIQCQHLDARNGISFHLVPSPHDPTTGTPGWTYRKGDRYITETVAAADHPNRAWAKTTPPAIETAIRIDLGSGPIPFPGFLGIDLYAEGESVLKGDVTDLQWFREKYGLADEIRASHVLEHMSHRDATKIFRDWVLTLKPGGTMTVSVPSLTFAAKRLLEASEVGDDVSETADYYLMMIYGYQMGEGHQHMNGFTENRLRQLALSCGLAEIEIRTDMSEGGGWVSENESLVLTGRRPGGE